MKFRASNPEKLMFPGEGITKGELIEYYERVAQHMLRHIRARPLMLQRFPDGIDHPGFMQKDIDESFPAWVAKVKVDKQGGTLRQAMACNARTLAYLADQACITPHMWLSRAPELGHPDRLVFDLDPSPDSAFVTVRDTALRIGELLESLGLAAFALITGSRGLHVWVPLRRRQSFEEVGSFARGIAELLAGRHPDTLTTAQRKAARGRRVYIDIMRNGYAQTVVAPYAVRARAGAPVAMPIRWEELGDRDLRPDRFTITSAWERLRAEGDAWAQMARHARELRGPRRRLDRLRAGERRRA